MANPQGGNQFGNYTLQPGYGDVKKQTALTQAAPLSGAPRAANAIGAPRRAGTAAKRGGRVQGKPQPQAPPPVQAPAPQGPSPGSLQAIAQIPGASPLVQQIFSNG